MTKFSALAAALGAVWAMEENTLATVLSIAAREHDVTVEALEAYRAKSLDRAEQATVRDGVAIISATGPMMKRANLFAAMSGATSYDILARDLTVARDNPKVKAAILNIDSGGGEVSGAGELASMIKAFAAEKPIVAYVNGMGASAAYWLASAADEIVVDPTAVLGSIGARMAIRKSDDPKGSTTFEFVSSQSPMKAADPATKEGAEHLQGIVDAMGRVLVAAVAENRGRSIDTILSDFGKGGMFVGQGAVTAGLADRVGTFEGVLAELSAARGGVNSRRVRATMSDELSFTAEAQSAAYPQSLPTAGSSLRPSETPAGGARHSPPPAPSMSREAAIRHLGKNSPEPLPAGMVEAAVASGQSFPDFAAAVADHSLAVQAARAEEAEIEAVALRISRSDLPISNPHPDAAVEARAQEILGAAALAAGDEVERIAARIVASDQPGAGAAEVLAQEILQAAALAEGREADAVAARIAAA